MSNHNHDMFEYMEFLLEHANKGDTLFETILQKLNKVVMDITAKQEYVSVREVIEEIQLRISELSKNITDDNKQDYHLLKDLETRLRIYYYSETMKDRCIVKFEEPSSDVVNKGDVAFVIDSTVPIYFGLTGKQKGIEFSDFFKYRVLSTKATARFLADFVK